VFKARTCFRVRVFYASFTHGQVDSAFYPPWDGKMSSNSFAWVTEGGDLGTADWGCLAGRCASLCLQAAHGGRAAGGSG